MNRIAALKNEAPPKIIAVGGGKGGIGKSTITAEIAKSIANTGKRVLCVDADLHRSSLHLLLHSEAPTFDFQSQAVSSIEDEKAHITDFVKRVDASNSLWLASLAASRSHPHQSSDIQPRSLFHQLRDIDFDWVIVDIPSDWDQFYARLFVSSDIPIAVTTPEPVTVKHSTDFFQRVSLEAIRQFADTKLSADEGFGDDFLTELPYHFNAKELAERFDEYQLKKALEEGIKRFEPYLVVNKVREGSERDLGFALCHAWHKEIGVYPRALGAIEYKDRRWFYNRRMTKNATGGERSLSEDIENLARALFNLENFDEKHPRPIPNKENLSMAEKIGINPDLEPRKIRQQTRRLWETYRRENLTQIIFSSTERRNKITENLKKLYKNVLSSSTGKTSNFTLNQQSEPADDDQQSTTNSTDDTRDEQSHSDKDPDWVDPDEVEGTTGSEIIEKRQSFQMSRHDLSVQTQIGMKFISAIEQTNVDKLPRKVYLKGYLRKIAKVLDFEVESFVERYLTEIEE